MTTEKIIADAELAACYFRALLANGVPMQAAVPLTSTYIAAHRMGEASKEEPKPPWEQGS